MALMTQNNYNSKVTSGKPKEPEVEDDGIERGEPEDLLKEVVPDSRIICNVLDNPVYGPPPYPLGFSLSKTSGHYGSLFAPIPGYKYAEKPPTPPPSPPKPAKTAVVHAVPRQVVLPLNDRELQHPSHPVVHYHVVPQNQQGIQCFGQFEVLNRAHTDQTRMPIIIPPTFQAYPYYNECR